MTILIQESTDLIINTRPVLVRRMTSGALCDGNKIVLDNDDNNNKKNESVNLNIEASNKLHEETMLPLLRKKLGPMADNMSNNNLLKFLFWKSDVNRAANRFQDFIKWRTHNPNIFDITPLQVSKDSELKRCLESDTFMAPDGAVAKDGSTGKAL